MWEGHELALLEYQEAICKEWTEVRGYHDTCWPKSQAFFSPEELEIYRKHEYTYPEWYRNPDFHLAHKSNLLRKAPEFYAEHFPGISDDLPYIWPVSLKEGNEKVANTADNVLDK